MTHHSSTQKDTCCGGKDCGCDGSNGGRGTILRDVAFLVILFAIVYLALTWLRPLGNPDEGRYTEIPREMLATGEWVLPQLNGFLYFYKPPLVYWMQAAAISVFGDNLIGLRLVPAFFGIFGIVVTYLGARHWYGRTAGLLSGIVLGSGLVYAILSQIILLDMAVAVFMAGSLFAFFAALLEEKDTNKRDWLFRGGMALAALALLCKGLIAVAVPGAIVFLWLLLLNQWKLLRHQAWGTGIVIFLIIGLPWHIAAYQGSEHWFDFYIVHEHFLRYLTDVSSREQPFWFFVVLFPVGLIPWTLFLPQAWIDGLRGGWKNRKQRRIEWALTIWIVFVILFFSISKSKLIPYVLPIYPALSVLVARYLLIALKENRPGLLRGIWIYVALGVGVAIAMPIVMIVRAGHTGPDAVLWLSLMGVVGLFAAAAVAHYAYRKNVSKALGMMIFTQLLLLFVLPPVAGQLQRPGTRAMAEFVRPYLTPTEQVYCLFDYGVYQDFPFYLDRVVGLTVSLPTEQKYGYDWEEVEPTDRIMEFDQIPVAWQGDKRVVMISRKNKLEDLRKFWPELDVHVWADDGIFQIISNRPLGEGAENVHELPEKFRARPVLSAGEQAANQQ